MADLASLPPPPTGQTGVSLSSLQNLPPPPSGQQGLSLQQAQAQSIAQKSNTPTTPMTTQQFAATPIDWNSLGHTFLSGLGNWFNQTAQQFKQGMAQTQRGVNEINQGGTPVQGLESGLRAESGIATAVSSPLAPAFNAMNRVIQPVADTIGSSKTVQDFANSDAGQKTSRVVEDLSNAGNIAGTILGVDQVAKVVPKVTSTIQNTAQGVKEAFSLTPEEQAAAQANARDSAIATSKAAKAEQVNQIAAQWERPTAQPTASFNKARQVIRKSPDAPKTLAQLGIDPRPLIEDGKYNTQETAQALRDTAGQLSADGLRPSLVAADKSTAPTPTEDIIATSLARAAKENGVTPADMGSLQKAIETEGAALTDKFPNGMGLADMHDAKITYAQNAGYSPFKSASDSIKATANRIISSTLAKAVETSAPKNLPVADFNAELSKYYRAANYLDSLHTKTAPVSLLQKGVRMISKFTGAALGEHLTGGVVSAFAGYQVGKAIESALENLSGRARAAFIHNIEITNPEAFKAVQTYLKNISEGNTGIPLLPPASAIQLPEGANVLTKPMIPSQTLPVSLQDIGPVSVPAAKGLPNVNLKTGRFQSTYQSVPKSPK